MTDNHRLNWKELDLVFENNRRETIEVAGRLQAIIDKILAMRAEIEDGHTCRLRFDLGERAGVDVVKGTVEKVY